MRISPTLKLIFIIVIIIALSYCKSFKPNRAAKTLANPVDISLSPNGKYMVVHNSTHLGIYEAFTGQQIEVTAQNYHVTAIRFASRSNMFYVGNANTQIWQVNIIEQNGQIRAKKSIKKHIFNDKQDSQYIVGICFVSADQYAAVLYSGGAIAALHTAEQGLITTGYFSAGLPTHIACTETDTRSIAISGTKFGGSEPVLGVYQINVQQLQIEVKVQSVVLDASILKINGLAMNNNTLYITSNSNSIYSYNYPLFDVQAVFYQGASQMYKIKFTIVQGEFVVANDSHILVGKPYTPPTYKAVELYSIEIYETSSKIFAVSAQGLRLSLIDTNGKASYLGNCEQGQFFNQNTKLCQKCNSLCSVCFSGSETCLQCQSKHFLSISICLPCIGNCLICVDQKTCSQCDSGFIVTEQKICGCPEGEVQSNGVCKSRGLKFWIFALMLCGVTLIMCLIIVVNIILLKRGQIRKDENLLAHKQDKNDIDYS